MAEQQIATKQIVLANTVLTSSSASIAWDMSLGDNFTHTFTEDTTLANPTNKTIGRSGFFELFQHVISPKTLDFDTDYVGPNETLPTITAIAGKRDVLQWLVLSDGKVLITSALNIGA